MVVWTSTLFQCDTQEFSIQRQLLSVKCYIHNDTDEIFLFIRIRSLSEFPEVTQGSEKLSGFFPMPDTLKNVCFPKEQLSVK